MTATSRHSVAGVRLAAVAAGIRYRDRDDMVLMELAAGSTVAGVFTRNAFCAAPVTVAREHLAKDPIRYLLINAGNANAGTGANGLRAARETCKILASMAGCAMSQVLPFSTGVIGNDLPLDPFSQATPALLQALDEDVWPRAARAIMTTDTVPKLFSRAVVMDAGVVHVTGMAKGSGMIRPDMATMLGFVATDAKVAQGLLQTCLEQAVAPSFNSITVDGDTSTNDACILAASGASGVEIDDLNSPQGRLFADAVAGVCMDLARSIVKDGEGATKLVEVVVEGARDLEEARAVAYTIAHSPLVKTAWFASDPNWGRILAAVGRAGLADLDIDRVELWLDDVRIVRDGGRDPDYTEQAGKAVFSAPEFKVRVLLGRGQVDTRVLTCDFSFDYVKINAEYRS